VKRSSGAIEAGGTRPEFLEEPQLSRISLHSERRKALDEALREMLASFPATWDIRVVLGERPPRAASLRGPSGPEAIRH
jgi:hypothetical protein